MNTLSTTSIKIRTLNELPLFAAIIVTLEYLMAFLPNISLTPLLLAVYFSARSYKQSFYLVSIYLILDIISTPTPLIYIPAMWIGWTFWIVIVKSKIPISIEVKGVFFGSLYGFVFLPFNVFVTDIQPWVYILADIPFQIIMMASNLLTLTLFFNSLKNLLTDLSTYDTIIA